MKQFTVFEWPWKCCTFETLSEAIEFILNHKPGMQDLCWVEDGLGNKVWNAK